MNILTHTATIPWQVGPGFFMTLAAYLLDAVAVTATAFVLYALLHRMLSHGERRGMHGQADEAGINRELHGSSTQRWNHPITINRREHSHHEA